MRRILSAHRRHLPANLFQLRQRPGLDDDDDLLRRVLADPRQLHQRATPCSASVSIDSLKLSIVRDAFRYARTQKRVRPLDFQQVAKLIKQAGNFSVLHGLSANRRSRPDENLAGRQPAALY